MLTECAPGHVCVGGGRPCPHAVFHTPRLFSFGRSNYSLDNRYPFQDELDTSTFDLTVRGTLALRARLHLHLLCGCVPRRLSQVATHSSPPRAQITGARMNVHLSNAFVTRLYVHTVYGDVHLDQLRSLYTDITTENGDVYIEVSPSLGGCANQHTSHLQPTTLTCPSPPHLVTPIPVLQEQRDTFLQYRSPGNLVCAAAPLVENVLDDFMRCDMTGGGSTAVHVY